MSKLEVDAIEPQSGTTLTIGASGDTITIPSGATFDASSGSLSGTLTTAAQPNITSVGTLTSFTSTGIDDNATSTAITIDSSENVGIGTSSPDSKLHIHGPDQATANIDTSSDIVLNVAGTGISTNNGGSVVFSAADGAWKFAAIKGLVVDGNNNTRGDLAFSVRNATTDSTLSEAMRIASSGNVGIGTSSPSATLDVVSSGTNNQNLLELNSASGTRALIGSDAQDDCLMYLYDSANAIKVAFRTDGNDSYINGGGDVGIGTSSPDLTGFGTGTNGLEIADATIAGLRLNGNNADSFYLVSGAGKHWLYGKGAVPMTFSTDSSERMRIDSSGNLLVGKTSGALATQGHAFYSTGDAAHTATGNPVLYINRLGTDGDLIRFFHDTIQEGDISVSGATVSYNGFTGTHWSRFTDNSKPTILKGTVLETLDEMCDWYNLEFETTDEEGNTLTQKIPYVLADGQSDGDVITYNHEGTDVQATIVKETDIKHVKSKVSDTVDAKNVYGVFVAYDEDGDGYNDFYVASVGSFVVRIKANETIAKGDLLQSNGDGTAKVQTDDAVRSSSFAKVLSTTIIETYEDGSYLVPCSLMC